MARSMWILSSLTTVILPYYHYWRENSNYFRDLRHRSSSHHRERTLSHCRPFIPLLQKLFFTSDVNGLHETKDYVSCGGVILCFEVMVVTREDFLLKFAALGQARKLAWPNLRSFSKNTSLVTTMTSKTNHHYSTANKCLLLQTRVTNYKKRRSFTVPTNYL